MSTKHSPLNKLTAEANRIARNMKMIADGNIPAMPHAEKIAASIATGKAKIGLAMDDKVITLEIEWSKIKELGEVALSAYILKLMREERVH